MDHQQRTRLGKIYTDRLYLIEFKQDSEDPSHYDFVISGSTANLYKIKLQTNQLNEGLKPLITCNCPDMFSWAKEYDTKCKHCCFVLIKVLRLPEDWLIPNYIQQNLDLAKTTITTKLQNLQMRADLTNVAYVEKYNQIKANGGIIDQTKAVANSFSSAGATEGSVSANATPEPPKDPILDKFKVTKELDGEEECPICFDSLDVVSSFQCPTCRNLVHQHCMEKWLSTGHKNCVYCRGDWSLLKEVAKKEVGTKSSARGRGSRGGRGGASIASYYQNLGGS